MSMLWAILMARNESPWMVQGKRRWELHKPVLLQMFSLQGNKPWFFFCSALNVMMFVQVLCLRVCKGTAWVSALRSRRECRSPWNWSYRQEWAAIWVLVTKPRSSARTVSVHNFQANSPDLTLSLSFFVVLKIKPSAACMPSKHTALSHSLS